MDTAMNSGVQKKLENVQQRLQSEDSDERRWAIYDLEPFDAADVVEILVEAIQDENRAVREAASEVMESLSPEVCTKKLTPLLGSERIEVRNITASVLVKYGQSAVQDLIPALVDTNEDVRKFSADILGLAWNTAAVPDLCKSAEEDSVDTVAVSSVEALGKIGDPRALKSLYAIFDRQQGMEPEAIEAIGLIGAEESVAFMTERLNHEDPVITFAIIDALGNLGQTAALEALFNYIADAPEYLKDHICQAILKVGQNANQLVLDAKHAEFMGSILESLSVGEEEVIALVLHQFTLNPDSDTIGLFFKNIHSLPSNIIVGLIRHAKQYIGYTDAVIELVKHEDDWVAYSALEAFDNLPIEAASPVLLDILKNYSGIRLLAAMRAVELLKPQGAQEILTTLAQDEQDEIRMEAQRVLDSWLAN